MTTTAMVVEPGSDWPGQIGDSTSVVAFSGGAEDLVRRTKERLGALGHNKQSVRVAVLACNSSAGAPLLAAGRSFAWMLLGAVSGSTCGRLILSASRGSSPEARQELLALAGALTEQLRESSATVSLWFTEASSGHAVRIVEPRTPAVAELRAHGADR
jgi:hypothetical protein